MIFFCVACVTGGCSYGGVFPPTVTSQQHQKTHHISLLVRRICRKNENLLLFAETAAVWPRLTEGYKLLRSIWSWRGRRERAWPLSSPLLHFFPSLLKRGMVLSAGDCRYEALALHLTDVTYEPSQRLRWEEISTEPSLHSPQHQNAVSWYPMLNVFSVHMDG